MKVNHMLWTQGNRILPSPRNSTFPFPVSVRTEKKPWGFVFFISQAVYRICICSCLHTEVKTKTKVKSHSWAYHAHQFSSVQSLSRVQLFATPWIQPSLPVHHHLPEFTQTHVHWVGDAIQPSHPLSSPSPPAPHPSQHQSLFQWVNSSHEVAKVLEFQL